MRRRGGVLFFLMVFVLVSAGTAIGQEGSCRKTQETARLSEVTLGGNFPVCLGYLDPYPPEILKRFPGLPKKHAGIDFQAQWGTLVHSVTGGEVIRANNNYIDGSGNPRTDSSPCYRGSVFVFDGKSTWIYGHMQNVDESLRGKTIQAGRVIGTVSSAGCASGVHLHVGVRPGRNPFDVGTELQSGPVEHASLNPAKQAELVSSTSRFSAPSPPSVQIPLCQGPSQPPNVSKNIKVATPGTTIRERGICFTPNSTATLHFRKPDGTKFPPREVLVGPDGTFNNFFTIPPGYPPGTYKFWAVDGPTQKRSNIVTYQVLPAQKRHRSLLFP